MTLETAPGGNKSKRTNAHKLVQKWMDTSPLSEIRDKFSTKGVRTMYYMQTHMYTMMRTLLSATHHPPQPADL